jgi:squalene synthase HpnC
MTVLEGEPRGHQLPATDAVLDQAADENFTVASLIVGRRQREHLKAIYGFARLVDDVGDEAAGDRNRMLDGIDAELDQIFAKRTLGHEPHPLMAALAVSARECSFPEHPFRRLVQANRQDQVVTRYETFDELMAYCRLSAAPVGELVLHVFEHATPDRIELSDRVCAGLQVTEHLQDVVEDLERGRIYMPREDLLACGCDPENPVGSPPAARMALTELESYRALGLLAAGIPLRRSLPLRPGIAVAGFVAGGRSALAELQRTQFSRPRDGANRSRRRTLAFGVTFLRTLACR